MPFSSNAIGGMRAQARLGDLVWPSNLGVGINLRAAGVSLVVKTDTSSGTRTACWSALAG